MKRVFVLFMLFVVGMVLVGCDIYADTSKKDMELIEVKVYDKDNNEIAGQYKNFRIEEQNVNIEDMTFNNQAEVLLLNSAAPVENYYYVNVSKNESYTIKFIFHSAKNYKLTKLILNNDPERSHYNNENIIKCENIEKIDNNYVVTLYVEKVEESNKFYHTVEWYKDNERNQFHTKGSNIYIKGVRFVLTSPVTTSCLK